MRHFTNEDVQMTNTIENIFNIINHTTCFHYTSVCVKDKLNSRDGNMYF